MTGRVPRSCDGLLASYLGEWLCQCCNKHCLASATAQIIEHFTCTSQTTAMAQMVRATSDCWEPLLATTSGSTNQVVERCGEGHPGRG